MKSDIYLWLYTLFVCGCITSMILFLIPDERNRQIAELGCSSVMILALMMPLTEFDINDYLSNLSSYNQQINDEIADKHEIAGEMNKAIIEQQLEEYILKEAEVQQIKLDSVSVAVMQYDNIDYIPTQIVYYSDYSIPIAFLDFIEEQLGVSKERQMIYEATECNQ